VVLSIAPESIPLRVDPHGTVRVGGTRLTLETVLDTFKQGASPQEIVAAFPDLDLADVYAVLTYYLRHRTDVDAYLQEQETKAASVRQKIVASQGDQRGLREQLLARREEKERQ
jgi:uncharacterized protein (DUF433 family)